MTIYVLDGDRSDERRRWELLVGRSIVHLQHDPGGFFVGQEEVRWDGGVIVVHQASKSQLEALQVVVGERENLCCIIISGGDEERCPDSGRMYFRKEAVNKPADQRFGFLFKQFWDDLQKSNGLEPNFSLLEPENLGVLPSLAILCQGYMAVCASFRGERAWQDDKILTALELMGWSERTQLRGINAITPDFGSKKDLEMVSDAQWWWAIFCTMPAKDEFTEEQRAGALEKLRAGIQKELPEQPRGIARLLMMIESTAVESPETVAEAYCEIADILNGKGLSE